ncbi:MAG TPA: CHAT domain-containing tetratricopeptide repeat protein [Thermoanaerobaculia bacterium]
MLLRRAGLPGVCLALTLGLAAGCRDPEPPPKAPSGPPAAQPRTLPLVPGSETELVLTAGETHSYRIDLPPDHFADLVVDQRGADVEVQLTGPDGRSFPKVDSPNDKLGPEPLPVLGAAGALRLDISGSSSGRYAVKVIAVRPATLLDRARVEAERGFAASEGLRRKGDGESLRAAAAGAEEAAARFRALGDQRRTADALYSLGRIRSNWEPRAALQAFEEAASSFRILGERAALGRTLNSMAPIYLSLGDPRTARDRALEALAIARSIGHARVEATALNNLGRAYTALGHTEKALSSYDRALPLWRQLQLPKEEGKTLSNRGSIFSSLGESERALDDLESALELLEESPEAANALSERAYVLYRVGRAGEAAADLEDALNLHRQTGNRRGEAAALSDLGLVKQSLGRREEARKDFETAVAAFQDLGDHPNEATALVSLGRLHTSSGNAGDAKAAFTKALVSFEASGRREGEAAARLGLAQVSRLQGDPQGALRGAETALALIEELRTEPGSHKLRSSLFASYQNAFAFAVDTAMELHGREPAAGYDGRAFEISERARARSLLDALAEAGAGAKGVDPALAARQAAAGERLAIAEQRRQALVETGAPAARLEAAERELRQRLGDVERIEAEIRRASGDRAAARPVTLKEIQKELDPENLLLAYSLGERRSFLWVVGPRSLHSWTLPPREELEAAAREAHTRLATSNRLLGRAQTDAALAKLSQLLLAPAAGKLTGRRLVVVPDGALHLLPFAALPEPPPGGGPLIARREVVTVPSASSLAAIRHEVARRDPPPAMVAVLADPVFTADDPRVTGRPGGPAAVATRGTTTRAFDRLPDSREEARVLLALAPPGERLSALDFAARRELVTGGALARFRIVHFATHGVLDTEHPELSGVALSMVDERGQPRDGFLRAYEIYRLRLPADLVVLSGCETALGREVRGEGMVGLTRAFFHAGARRVLVSLWPVEDRATAELMRGFYEGLFARGLPPAEALRRAQDDIRRRPDRQAPHYWAGFILQGDWR